MYRPRHKDRVGKSVLSSPVFRVFPRERWGFIGFIGVSMLLIIVCMDADSIDVVVDCSIVYFSSKV